jgi:cadmium resistance transport/sequestration family protein
MWAETGIAAAIAFAVTNLDDLALLIIWFSTAKSRSQVGRIILGQYLGFLTLVSLSLPGWIGGQWIAPAWLGWLGLVPIGLGLRALFATDDEGNSATPITRRSLILSVALMTIANGGDNIGIYLPFFAGQSRSQLGLTLGVFLVMVALWCGGALWLVRHSRLMPWIDRFGDRVVPIVLIALGIYIWWDNQAWRVLYPVGA